MADNNEMFNFTYSAKQQEEIKRIRSKYISPEETKMDRLRKLDRSAYKKAKIYAITLGIIGTLILGTGMSLAMTELSGFPGGTALFIGIPVGIFGIVLVALAYPVYNLILKRERQRIAPEIIRLTDELMK